MIPQNQNRQRLRQCVTILAVALWMFLIPICASAQGLQRPARKMWLVVVSADRANAAFSLPDYQNLSEDARTFFDQVLASKESGAAFERASLLLESPVSKTQSRRATADELRTVLHQIARQATYDDIFCLAISCGAISTADQCRLLLEDANPNRLSQTTILTPELAELWSEIHCRSKFALANFRIVTPIGAPRPLLSQVSTTVQNTFKESEFNTSKLAPILCVERAMTQEMPRKSDSFFSILSTTLSGATDFNPDASEYWITVPAIAHVLRTRYASSKEGRDATTAFLAANDFPNVALARNARSANKIDDLLTTLHQRQNEDSLDRALALECERLLMAVPTLREDKELRLVCIDYLSGKASVNDLKQKGRKALLAKELSPAAAEQFAEIITQVQNKVADKFIRTGAANLSVQAGLTELVDRLYDPLDPEIAREIGLANRKTNEELRALLVKVRMAIGNRPDLSPERATELCVSGMMSVLDSFSSYVSPTKYKEIENQLINSKFPGIGVQLYPDPQTGQTTIFTPDLGGPAFVQGIRGGDRIAAVNGRDVRTYNWDRVSEMLGAEAGTKIRLVIERDGAIKPITYDVVTKPIRSETVIGVRREPNFEWSYWLEPKADRIAYICLTDFVQESAEDLKKAVRKVIAEGATGLVLDLRFNSGGVKRSAVEVADIFLDDVAIVTFRSRGKPPETAKGSKFATVRDLPLAVLVNRETASASEIVAAALADQQRAVVIGERTFGKGCVQDMILFQPMRFALRLTTEYFDRPSGRNLHRSYNSTEDDDWGVRPTPGYDMPLYYEEFKQLKQDLLNVRAITSGPPAAPPANDVQLKRAIEYLKKK